MVLTPLQTIDYSLIEMKIDTITRFLSKKRVVIAFSGGVDSTLVAYFASKYAKDSLLVMQTGLSVGIGEAEVARQVANDLGLPLRFIEYNEFELDTNYAKNPENRCYYCKSLLHHFLEDIRRNENYDVVINGTNATDILGHRPGYLAIQEFQAQSPLLNAGLSKLEVRYLAHNYGLRVWDKPATACLASRFQTGVPITANALKTIAIVEDKLKSQFNLKQIRLRFHGEEYHLEIDSDELLLLDSTMQHVILNYIKTLGLDILPKIRKYHSRER